MIDVNKVRADFPFFAATDLAYLDNSATSQNPKCVMDAEWQFYVDSNANPFRGIYELSERATSAYEHGRETVKDFIHAKSTKEIVFTRNASESLNLIAYSFAPMVLEEGDEILVSILEHHSNSLGRDGAEGTDSENQDLRHHPGLEHHGPGERHQSVRETVP